MEGGKSRHAGAENQISDVINHLKHVLIGQNNTDGKKIKNMKE